MIVRICLNGTNGRGDRVRFDLSIGADMKPLADMAYFGFYGSLRNTEVSSAILLNADAVGAYWAPDDSGRLLYFNNFEVHVYDPTTHSDILLTRVGETISAVAWHPEGNSVLVVRADTIEAIELDGRDHRNVFELAHCNHISTLWVNQNGQEAYFVGEVSPDRGLFGLELQER